MTRENRIHLAGPKLLKRVLRVTTTDGDQRETVERIMRSVDVNTPVQSAEHIGRETEQTAVEADLAISYFIATGFYVEHSLLDFKAATKYSQPFFYIDSTCALRLISAQAPRPRHQGMTGIHLVKSQRLPRQGASKTRIHVVKS